MPDLLLELFSEEIPARMQGQAARDLERMARERLSAAGFESGVLAGFAGPRRLTLHATGLPAAQADRSEEIKGPRANAPPQALDGFLRKTGLARDQLVERDGVLFASVHRPGRVTAEIVAEMVPAIVRAFPWPKSMTWASGTLRWVRPLKRIACLFDGAVVPFEIDGIASTDLTEGHRFMGADAGAPFRVTDFDQYRAELERRFVILDAGERKRRIAEAGRAAAALRGLEVVEDEGLLEETAGLAEWPVPLLGDMDPAFLDLPPEVIRTSMRTHQKYFAVRRPGEAGLAPHFVVVANIEASDGGAALAAGNARVLSARLNDARFFWDEDRRVPLTERLERLKGVTFHAKLGTMYERVQRIEALAREIAPLVGADPELAALAARLCKADLATGMVGEFPELQGVMGGYYVREQLGASFDTGASRPAQDDGRSEDPTQGSHAEQPAPAGVPKHAPTPAQVDAVADAVRDHYKPLGPSDSVPAAPVTVAVALADKLDTLVGFFAIDERPTGSKDPYALRRAALGVIRIVLLGEHRLRLAALIRKSGFIFAQNPRGATGKRGDQIAPDLLAFFADRLKAQLRDEGKRHDLVDAVFALGDNDLVRITRRVEALDAFLATADGAALLAGYKRAANILRAEEKKAPGEADSYRLNPELTDDALHEEAALVAALREVQGEVDGALQREDFTGAMRRLAHLRAPVDAFFDRVLVNDPDPDVRLRRLRLLTQVRDTANRVADFSLISG